ncbi:MAG TPA: transporter [Phycisphaerales bacterium]|nr:transporter [Phycisphaerales bacterium]
MRASGQLQLALAVAAGCASGAVAAGVLQGDGPGGASPADKSGYHLFNPTPREQMRELSTDRPDTTESPYTVDAGHFQVELSFVDLSFDDTDSVETRAVSVAPMLLKVGLTNDIDLALGLDPYTRVRTEDGAAEETVEGFGDTVLRLKANLWGNDGGDTALALMPFVKFPTASDGLGNDHVEGGLIIPFGMSLPNEFSMGLMAEFDLIRDAADEGYVVDFVHTATIGRPLVGELSGYVEYAGFYNLNADEDYRGYFDAGLTYAVTDDLQLDTGIRVGLTEAAEDFGVFAGIAWRY